MSVLQVSLALCKREKQYRKDKRRNQGHKKQLSRLGSEQFLNDTTVADTNLFLFVVRD